MKAKSISACNAILDLMYRGRAWASVGAAPAIPLLEVWVSLHIGPPASGDQTEGEADFPGYARVALARDTASWSEPVGGLLRNTRPITFPECGAGAAGAVLTDCAVGIARSGAGLIWHMGELSRPWRVVPGVAPQIPAGELVISER